MGSIHARSDKREEDFLSALETKAGQISREFSANGEPFSPLDGLDKEITLALRHMDRLREVHKAQFQSLLQVDCYTSTELIQMEQRTPRYSPYRFPEREKLQRRLLAIEAERRKLALGLEDKLRPLREQLLKLIIKRGYLSP